MGYVRTDSIKVSAYVLKSFPEAHQILPSISVPAYLRTLTQVQIVYISYRLSKINRRKTQQQSEYAVLPTLWNIIASKANKYQC